MNITSDKEGCAWEGSHGDEESIEEGRHALGRIEKRRAMSLEKPITTLMHSVHPLAHLDDAWLDYKSNSHDIFALLISNYILSLVHDRV